MEKHTIILNNSTIYKRLYLVKCYLAQECKADLSLVSMKLKYFKNQKEKA